MSPETECKETIGWFKDAIKAIIKNHYGDTIKIDFDNFTICIDDRCAKYGSYERMLLPDNDGNPSEKSLNTTSFT
jgi:hypothetical protein